jgi:hypothetical protein
MRAALLEKANSGALPAEQKRWIEEVKERAVESPNKNANVMTILESLVLLANTDKLLAQMYEDCPYADEIVNMV